MVIGHSGSMRLTDTVFLQTHVTFCEYLVFHEFRRNLYITLAKYLEQDGIAHLLFSICLYTFFNTQRSFYLGKIFSIFTSELYAILMALNCICNVQLAIYNFLICVDSRSVLCALKNWNGKIYFMK